MSVTTLGREGNRAISEASKWPRKDQKADAEEEEEMEEAKKRTVPSRTVACRAG